MHFYHNDRKSRIMLRLTTIWAGTVLSLLTTSTKALLTNPFRAIKNGCPIPTDSAATATATTIAPKKHTNQQQHQLQQQPKKIVRTRTSSFFQDRAYVNKDIKMPDPVPQEAHAVVLDLLNSGRLYRYNNIIDHNNHHHQYQESIVSLCEQDIARYTGFKYCVALNSCGSALMLLLKTTGLPPGGKVLSNAFTFGAVPSAIEHAGGIPIYVESTMDMIIDLDDLDQKLSDHPDCHHVLISHMRGKVGDMTKIKQLCDQHKAILLEDCAHSLGVLYKGEHSGHVGIACAISSQSYKMINSGEGGFVLTNDPDIAAGTAVYSGAYETLYSKHITVPPREAFKDYPQTLPNYSLRMSNLAAAVVRPQINTLEERIAKYNRRYVKLEKTLEERVGEHMTIPQVAPSVTRMVHDSFQFNLDEKFTDDMVQSFLNDCGAHGLPVELFGHETNSRNFINWRFAPTHDPLPNTAKMLRRACDVRMPLMWDDADFDDMANVIVESIEKVLNDNDML